jgi:hypothetical protein
MSTVQAALSSKLEKSQLSSTKLGQRSRYRVAANVLQLASFFLLFAQLPIVSWHLML